MTNPDPLIAYLAAHDAPCPGCGYNLRGLQTNSCPECGRTLSLKAILHKKNGVEIRIKGPENPDIDWYGRAALTLVAMVVIGFLIVVVLFIILSSVGQSSGHPLLP